MKAKPVSQKQIDLFLIRCNLGMYPVRVGVEHTPRAVFNRFGRFLRGHVRGFQFRTVLDVSA